ncbi:MAG: flippase [Roseofilum sp. SBFL]|uniref:flippase n=1 Tax=unclassified Roseofilum TaxID=2620099 RepID=UPI001B0CA801|nr:MULTISPECIES: flippase [unclassified Roseofilum]MBP0014258.1 flippase [Roseofilum sp. SID3]MBP0023753.1 flippase [Roseofilum sp. SID2]MBP0038896.1 flippase [Roseofilum sp. SID1]MBP0043754.1 flippase [Roseofilum sp. SBFL]
MFNKISQLTQNLSPKLRQMIGNASWLASEKLLQMCLGLLIGVWVARYLGPQKFGLLSYALAFTSLFAPLATLGLDKVVVRDLVQYPSEKNRILGTAFAIKLVSSILAYLLEIMIISWIRPDDKLTHVLVAVVGLRMCFQVFYTIDLWFQSQVESKYTVWSKNSAYLCANGVKILLISLQAPVIFFAWNSLGEIVLGAIGLLILYQFKGNAIAAWRMSLSWGKRLLKNGLPLMFSGIAVIIYLRIDAIMLGQIFGDESVGIYSVATKISELWYFIPTALVSSASPALIEAKGISISLYEQRWQKLLTMMTGISYAIAIPMVFLAKPMITLMYGPNYAASGSVLAIHIWATVFVSLGIAKSVWIVTEGLTHLALVSTSCGAVINILLNLVLIPRYQEVGAAIATVISYGCADYLVYITYPRFQQIGRLMTKALILENLWKR